MNKSTEIGIEAIAFSLGKGTVTNEQLQLENPNWDMTKTLERTGVVSRPLALSGCTALDLAHEAAVEVMSMARLGTSDIDALIFCTQTPDHILPPNSTLLHGRLDMPNNVMAFDISHACSGFMYSLGIARSLVASGTARRVLVITADTYSRLIHPLDRSIRPLFGDGAAATIVSGQNPRMTVMDISFGTSGKHAHRFMIKNGGARHKTEAMEDTTVLDGGGRINSPNHIHMDGLGVLSFFNSVVPTAVREILVKHDKKLDDISLFVFHQASQLALDGIARSLKLPRERLVIDMEDTGNLVSASIPVVLAKLLARHSVSKGELFVLCGFGVGLSWATALVQF